MNSRILLSTIRRGLRGCSPTQRYYSSTLSQFEYKTESVKVWKDTWTSWEVDHQRIDRLIGDHARRKWQVDSITPIASGDSENKAPTSFLMILFKRTK